MKNENNTSENAIQIANKLGHSAGCNAAEWAIQDLWGGRATRGEADAARDILEKIEEGELDLPMPNLSGEWADGETPKSLFTRCTGFEWNEEDPDDCLAEELCQAWETGVSEGFEFTLAKSAREFLESLEDPEKIALAHHLGVPAEDLHEIEEDSFDHYGLKSFSYGRNSYAVGTDEEADDACRKYIEQSLWAFRPSFILSNCGLPHELEEVLQAYQGKECEDANDALLALVNKCGDFDALVQDAISADGRGHFLSGYDGEENEEEVSGVTFYIYKN